MTCANLSTFASSSPAPFFNCAKVRNDLSRNGYVKFSLEIPPVLQEPLSTLRAEFDKLPLDRYDARKTRHRAYGKFVLNPWSDALLTRPVNWYFQGADLNPLDGGKVREFAPLGAVSNNVWLKAVILQLFAAIPIGGKDILRPWDVGVHIIRAEPLENFAALPSPPHPHRDGEPFTAIIVLERYNVKGGRTIICKDTNTDHEPVDTLFEDVLQPLDIAMVVDHQVFHHVTPVERANQNSVGFRDTVLVEFTPFVQDMRTPNIVT